MEESMNLHRIATTATAERKDWILRPVMKLSLLLLFAIQIGMFAILAHAAPVEKILFASDRDGNFEIYVMNPDGTQNTRLTNNSAEDTSGRWSPDGNKIVFTSN